MVRFENVQYIGGIFFVSFGFIHEKSTTETQANVASFEYKVSFFLKKGHENVKQIFTDRIEVLMLLLFHVKSRL